MAIRLPLNFVRKIVELVGAGLASAAGAFLFGQLSHPNPPPLPQIVQFATPQQEIVRVVREENAFLIEQLRKETDSQKQPSADGGSAARASAPAPKAPKPQLASPQRREPKSAALAEHKPRPEDAPQPAQARPVVSIALTAPVPAVAPIEAHDTRPVEAAEPDGRVISTLKHIPGWFLPSPERLFGDVPRPPMPVGEFVQGTM
jgi:hypothetical protein